MSQLTLDGAIAIEENIKLGILTPNQKKVLDYLLDISPQKVGYKTISTFIGKTLGKGATVDNRVRELYKKNYLDKELDRWGKVRYWVKPEVVSQLRPGRAK